MYGPAVPGRLARLTPKGRARMRALLQQQLHEAGRAGASDSMLEELREELRRHGG
jgi:hypothetical protein